MINEEESYCIMDIKEADPQLEKHRKEVIEKYIEYVLVLMQDFKIQGKSLDEYIDYMKTILWYIKEERAESIKNDLGV
ncbi:hypothetical protein AYK20_05145 [Thermoplasmatales archaeon SG8-52-1]|nr:MAG: hypothetical protein AYK20_05145 [Thermoplasmatales archaeon SG8-52-1]